MSNIYDFDGTIYKGDSSLDFIIFSFSRHPKLWIYIPRVVISFMLYGLKVLDRKQFKQVAFSFVGRIALDKELSIFWKSHSKKIKTWYTNQKSDTDIIISASPEFLLEPIARQLGTQLLIATRMDIKTGSIEGENCRGEEKVKRLLEAGSFNIQSVYSDTSSDLPLLKLTKNAYMVKGSKITKISV